MLSVEPSDRSGIFGQTGSGKTEYLKRELLEPLMAAGVRLVVIDVKDELSVRGRPREMARVGPLPHRWTATQVAMQPEILAEEKLSLAVVPDEMTPKKCARAFALVANLLKALGEEQRSRPVVLVLEECEYWATYEQELLTSVAKMWRDYGVSVVFVSQRAVGVPIAARAQLNQVICFQQSEPADIDAIRLRTEITDPTFHARVQRLQPWKFETWRAGVSNVQEERRQRRSGGSGDERVHPERSSEGSGSGNGDALDVGAGEQGERPDVADLQVREAGGAEVAPPKKRGRPKKKPSQPPPNLVPPRTKPRRRRVA